MTTGTAPRASPRPRTRRPSPSWRTAIATRSCLRETLRGSPPRWWAARAPPRARGAPRGLAALAAWSPRPPAGFARRTRARALQALRDARRRVESPRAKRRRTQFALARRDGVDAGGCSAASTRSVDAILDAAAEGCPTPRRIQRPSPACALRCFARALAAVETGASRRGFRGATAAAVRRAPRRRRRPRRARGRAPRPIRRDHRRRRRAAVAAAETLGALAAAAAPPRGGPPPRRARRSSPPRTPRGRAADAAHRRSSDALEFSTHPRTRPSDGPGGGRCALRGGGACADARRALAAGGGPGRRARGGARSGLCWRRWRSGARARAPEALRGSSSP